ncbi:MAG: hypothetical protein E7066_09700 [Lentimicrobiaceae bacterium]|nr:hypothetical protein [Lentimicrobiaceae bacterium]
MLEWLLEVAGDFLGDLFESGAEVVGDLVSSVDIGEVISTGLLIAGAITVANLTESAIRNELNKRQELKNKGVTSAVITDFIQNNGYAEVTLAALNANNQQVGTVKMKAKSSSGIKKGDKIVL